MTSTNSQSQHPLLLGHRGARKYAPENTFAAFDLALEQGCDGFEFDVRCTANRRLLIWHDATLKRMRVARAAYERLCQRALPVRERQREDPQHSPQRLACLEDVIAAYASRAYLDIEIKVAGIEREVANLIAANPPQRGYVVSSFRPEVVDALSEHNSALTLGWIVRDRRLLKSWQGRQFEILIAHYSLVTRALVEAAHQRNRKLFVWTVNRARLMLQLAGWGVDAIISDDTRLLHATLGGGR